MRWRDWAAWQVVRHHVPFREEVRATSSKAEESDRVWAFSNAWISLVGRDRMGLWELEWDGKVSRRWTTDALWRLDVPVFRCSHRVSPVGFGAPWRLEAQLVFLSLSCLESTAMESTLVPLIMLCCCGFRRSVPAKLHWHREECFLSSLVHRRRPVLTSLSMNWSPLAPPLGFSSGFGASSPGSSPRRRPQRRLR